MNKIKFGTDGWRAIIAKEYTTANVARVAYATAQWIKNTSDNHSAVIGYDCRFGGQLFTETTISVLVQEGITVYTTDSFVSTPMVSLSTPKHKAFAGIVITASHNPPSYNGYKIKAHYGGPAIQQEIDAVEALIAALYFDGGLDIVNKFVSQFIYPNIKELSEDPGSKDYKTRLQEYYAKKGRKVVYDDISTGPDHNKEFVSEVLLDDDIIGMGRGKSKKSAQQHAAKQALSKVS